MADKGWEQYSLWLDRFSSNLLALILLSSPEHHHRADKPVGQSQGQERRNSIPLSTLDEESNESSDDLWPSQFPRRSQGISPEYPDMIGSACLIFHLLERRGRRV